MRISVSLVLPILAILYFPLFIFGQSSDETAKGEESDQQEFIAYGDIPLRSVQVINETRQAFHDLLPANTIRKLKVANNIFLATVDTGLLIPVDIGNPSVNLRYLENRKINLQQEQKKIVAEEAKLNEILLSLEKVSGKLNQEIVLWENTRRKWIRENLLKPEPEKLAGTIAFLDSASVLINSKINALTSILEKTVAMGVNINLTLEKTLGLIDKKEDEAFKTSQSPFFQMIFTADYQKDIKRSIEWMKEYRLKELHSYLSENSSRLLMLVILFCFLVWFFFYTRDHIRINLFGFGKFYKDNLLVVISHPILAAIILTLVSTYFIFPGRPLIFRELMVYIMAYPLINLMINILHNRYHKYLHAFSAIIVLYLIIVVVAPETSLYRLLLMVIAVVETGLIIWLLVNLKKNTLFNEKQRKYLFLFITLHLLIALTGMGSNLAGSVTLTEICINAVFANIFYGMIIFISMMIINGLLAAGIDSPEGQRVNAIRLYGELIKERSIILVNGVAILAWFLSILNSFRADETVISGLHHFYTYKFTLGTASFSLDLVVVFFLVLFASYYLAQMLQIVLEKDLLNRIPLSKGLPHTISMGVKYVLIVSGFLLALNVSGIPMDKITIILGAFSVGIGFGLQNIFSNMVSGLILLFERPIQLGDTVQVGNLTGDVKSIDLRSSNIQTFDGAEVIVPNGQLISNEVINWTLSDKRRRVEIPVGVDYSSDPKVVRNLFMEILSQHNSVLQDPEPVVFFSGLGESSLDFTLVFWISDYSLGRSVKSDVLFDVFRVLKENGINIPFPQRDVHIV